jgi:aldehyde decarbonylase
VKPTHLAQVVMTNKQDYHFLKPNMPENAADNLLFSKTATAKVKAYF